MRSQILFEVCLRVAERNAMILQQRVYLEPCFESEQALHLTSVSAPVR